MGDTGPTLNQHRSTSLLGRDTSRQARGAGPLLACAGPSSTTLAQHQPNIVPASLTAGGYTCHLRFHCIMYHTQMDIETALDQCDVFALGFSELKIIQQQTSHDDPMLPCSCAIVCDAGPTLNHRGWPSPYRVCCAWRPCAEFDSVLKGNLL